jgi:hypothetical protein
VQRRVNRSARRRLFGRQARLDLLERPRILAQLVRQAVEVAKRRLGRLPVVSDGSRLAVPGDAVVLDLDVDDVRGVLRAA